MPAILPTATAFRLKSSKKDKAIFPYVSAFFGPFAEDAKKILTFLRKYLDIHDAFLYNIPIKVSIEGKVNCMKELYTAPDFTVICFATEDIMTGSNEWTPGDFMNS